MVAFESSLGLGFDGITFISDSDSDNNNNNNNNNNNSIGWIACDTSKPGRERSDTKECWVIQSTLTAATTLIDNINSRGLNFEDSRTAARVESHDLLLDDFKKFILEQYKGSGRDGEDVPVIIWVYSHH